MTEIKLQKESIDSRITGITPDIDENNTSFNRLTFSVKHPATAKMHYWELNKSDSDSLLIKKEEFGHAFFNFELSVIIFKLI